MTVSAPGLQPTNVEDVLPAPVDEPAVPVELNQLAPWHRARKQLVREKQWLRLARQLISKERNGPCLPGTSQSAPEVKYLTLPGIDYLDVRQLADVCRELDCRLSSTGFLFGEESNRHLARAQLREKALIDGQHITADSHTFQRRFEDISHPTGIALRDLQRRAPFHIVNIDACGSVAPPGATHSHRLVDALHRIIEMQLRFMGGRWLLFVTTDALPDSIARETLDRLCDAIFENADTNDDFRQHAVPLFEPGATDIRVAAKAAAETAGTPFLQLFGLGLAKWLLHLARRKDWDMKTHHPFCYSTTPKGDNRPSMVCLAFEFLPASPGLHDPFGVTRAGPTPGPQHGDTSVRAVVKIREMTNADTRIYSDESLRIQMTENLRQSLEEAGYTPAALERLEV